MSSALKEFANFITMNMANLSETYARLLAEKGKGYETFQADRRTASARRLLKAVVEACHSETTDPLCRLFDGRASDSKRWVADVEPPQPLLEVECLGQTLTPVVTNLDAGKFLWQILAEARETVFLPMASLSVPAPPAGEAAEASQDLAERKQVEARLRQLSRAVEQSGSSIIITDTEGYIEYVNPKFTETTGYTAQEAIGQHTRLLKSGEKSPEEYKQLWDTITAGHEWRGEFHNRRKNGELYWESTSISPIRDEQGVITHFLAVKEDITEQKQARAALQSSEMRYRGLFEDSPISLWEEDFSTVKNYIDNLRAEGVTDFRTYFTEHPEAVADCALQVKIVDVNRGTLELYHAQSKDEFFAGLGQVFGEESFEAFKEELMAIVEGQTWLQIEAINNTLTGDRRNLSLTWSVAPGYEETLSRVLVSIIDITERKHLEQQVEALLARRTRQVETSTEIAQEIALAPAMADLFQRVVNLVQERFGYYHTHLYTLQDENLVMQEGVGEAGRKLKEAGHKIALAAEQSLVAHAARTGQPVLVPDVSQEPAWLPNPLLPETKSELAVPIKLREEIVGVVDVQSATEGGLSQADQLLLMGLCGQIGVAISSRRAEEALARRVAELETVARISTAVSTILETDKLLQKVTDLTKEQFDLYHAQLYLLDEAEERLNLVAGAGQVGQQMVAEGWSIPLDQEQSIVVRAARTQKGLIFNDVSATSSWLPSPLLPDMRSEMAVPLVVGDQLLGVLDVQADEINRFTEEDLHVKTVLATQIAVALQNARLYEQAQAALVELQQSQGLLRTIIDATPDWIFIKNREHRYQLVNQAYADSMHLTPENFIGKDDLEIGFPKDIVKGNPEKGIRGFWPDDTEVMDTGQEKIIDVEPAVVDDQPVFLNTIKIPLRDAGGNVWGVLGFVHDITEREQLLAEAERRARELAVVQNVIAAVNATDNVLKSLPEVTEYLRDLAPLDVVTLAAYTPGEPEYEVFAFGAEVEAVHFARRGIRLPVEGTCPGWVITHNDAWLEEDFREAKLFMEDEQLVAEGLASRLMLPLRLGGQVIGTLNLASVQPGAFNETHLPPLWQIAGQMAMALERSRLFEQTQRRARREQTIRQITEKMRAATSLEELVKTAAEELGQRFSAEYAMVELGIGNGGRK